MSTDTSAAELALIVERAAAASAEIARLTPRKRARLLDAMARALETHSDALVPIAARESHLPEARLRGELARTAYQLRSFVPALERGDYLEVIIDHADAGHPVAPAPDLRRMLVPLGPVAVYAAGNFPFAFSVAGGDTASAIAAGCPVVVKAHPGHPELSAAVATVLTDALDAAEAPAGTLGIVFGFDAGVELLRHPAIAAGAFTGSTAGGRALLDVANGRPTPIPFYGELGSINPVFVSAEAAASRADALAAGFVASYTLGAGQFCTKPGVLVVPSDTGIVAAVLAATKQVAPAGMLNAAIADRLTQLESKVSRAEGVDVLVAASGDAGQRTPSLFRASAAAVLANPAIVNEERFGASAVIVECETGTQYLELAKLFSGNLTATIQADSPDDAGIGAVLPELVARSGRVIWNEWPTGVSISASMHHGGPFPSSTSSLHTSVGITAIRRFLRPVCYQGMPEAVLPAALQDDNPLRIVRTVDGSRIGVPAA